MRSEGRKNKSGERKRRASLSNSAALWEAPGKAMAATEKCIRTFRTLFETLDSRPCCLCPEKTEAARALKDICLVPHNCGKSVYRERCPRHCLDKAELAVEHAKKEGKEISELIEHDLTWRAAILIWGAGFTSQQILAIIREAGDGPETSKAWGAYKEGGTQLSIKLVESAGAEVPWNKKPGYDGAQFFKSAQWKKVGGQDQETDQG